MSGEIWLPQWTRVNLGGPSGAPYTRGQNIKLLWHSWEGTNWNAAEGAFGPYPPHIGAKIFDEVHQYVPLDEHAYALASSQSEAEFVIQVELAGFAKDMRDLSYEALKWLAKNVLEPILFFHDVPDVHPLFYDDKDGITLASSHSPIRMSQASWNAYSGHVGHQHAPSPDDHWDPGRLDVDTIIRIARENQHQILNPSNLKEYPMVFIAVPDGQPEALVDTSSGLISLISSGDSKRNLKAAANPPLVEVKLTKNDWDYLYAACGKVRAGAA